MALYIVTIRTLEQDRELGCDNEDAVFLMDSPTEPCMEAVFKKLNIDMEWGMAQERFEIEETNIIYMGKQPQQTPPT